MSRAYRPWTDEERAAAVEAVRAKKKPREVLDLFPGRTPQDVRNMLSQTRYKLEGRCGCGKPMPDDPTWSNTHCPACVQRTKARLDASRALGTCNRCGMPADTTLTSCRRCHEKKQEWAEARRRPPSGRPDYSWNGLVRWISSGRMGGFVPLMPPGEWKVVDLFGGSASFAVEAAKVGHREVVYNDVHPTLCDLVEEVRAGRAGQLVELTRDLERLDPAEVRALYRRRDQLTATCRAALLLSVTQSVEGRNMHAMRMSAVVPVSDGYRARAEQLGRLLAPAEVLNRDFAQVIREHDGPRTFFFVDPPYPLTARYEHNLTPERFVELASALRGIRGKYLLATSTSRFAAACVRDHAHTWWRISRAGPVGHRLLVATNYVTDMEPADLSTFQLKDPAFEADFGTGPETPPEGAETPPEGSEFRP